MAPKTENRIIVEPEVWCRCNGIYRSNTINDQTFTKTVEKGTAKVFTPKHKIGRKTGTVKFEYWEPFRASLFCRIFPADNPNISQV